jgi:dual specificity phosphatase 12
MSRVTRRPRWRSHRALPDAGDADYFPAKEIIKNLWIGSEGDSRSPSFYKKHGIALVINATANIPFRAPADVDTYRIPVDDSPDENQVMLSHFPTVVPLIDDVLRYGHGVLVHCRAGMQRSAAVVAAYLMWKKRMSADQAFEFINRKKNETFWPVPTFEAALRSWEDALRRDGTLS